MTSAIGLKKSTISKATRNLIHMCQDILETKTIDFVFVGKNMLVSSGPVIIKVLIMFAGVLGLTQARFRLILAQAIG